MKYIFSIIALFFIGISFSQDPQSQAILDKLSKKMKAETSFYIEFSANITNSVSGVDQNESGKGWVKGNKYFASYGENTIISNGVKSWTVVKEEKSIYETDAESDDEESLNPRKLMTIWETGFKNKYGKETKINEESVHMIYLYPKNPGSVEYHTIILYISKSNELKRVVMKMKDNTVMTYRLTKYQANPEVSDSKFVFDSKKYPGYTIIRD